MSIYTDQGAETMKPHAGTPWRPSNGTEGEMFTALVCCRCETDFDGCQINLAAMCFLVTEPEYPTEWQIGADGQPCCTAFREVQHG